VRRPSSLSGWGYSSILLSIDAKTVLIDSVFAKIAAPVSFIVKRFQPPVITIDDLPRIDYILISHDHYDYLDMKTIKHFSIQIRLLFCH
jgi:L-ascorbate metabolism protein UlaG (beta-lactamase superfamily)